MTPSAAIVASVAPASKRSASTSVAPTRRAMPRPAFSPKMWVSGSGTNSTSSAVISGGSTDAI